MAYTTPTTRSTGHLVTAAEWNTDLVENIKFLANPPACRVCHNANQSVGDGAAITVAFNQERFDTDSMHSTSVNNNRITFNTAGLYLVSFVGHLASAADYVSVWAGIRLNGATPIVEQFQGTLADNATPYAINISTVYKFAAADWIEVRFYQNNSASAARNLLVTANTSPEFSATWIGRG